jgi:hypothetical protein
MKPRKYTEEQIIAVPREAEAGARVVDLCRKYGMSDATYYNWKAKYAGLTVSELKRLGGAYITERIMPGVVYMDHGARYDPIVPGQIDRGGAINTITPHNLTSRNATGMVVSSFLVEVEKADLDEMRNKYPEAFKRQYQAQAGLRLERMLEKNSY